MSPSIHAHMFSFSGSALTTGTATNNVAKSIIERTTTLNIELFFTLNHC